MTNKITDKILQANFLHVANTFQSLTLTQRKILSAFCYFFKRQIIKNYKESYPPRSMIASRAKTSVGEVSRFLTEFGHLFFTEYKQRKEFTIKGVRYFSNVYVYDEKFFIIFQFMKDKGIIKSWPKRAKGFLEYLNENPLSVLRKNNFDEWVSSNVCAHSLRSNAHTISLSESYDSLTRYGSDKSPPNFSSESQKILFQTFFLYPTGLGDVVIQCLGPQIEKSLQKLNSLNYIKIRDHGHYASVILKKDMKNFLIKEDRARKKLKKSRSMRM